ncbi:MAG TPA: hypothetical protein PLP07_00905 [Pyrinomonadaceae bacterium]|nr:hypothetical protein [Chloracidobacterium sp.]MBP9934264.1 hypothetical protein [Pyrinomonadaceae bacterium]MBK7801540.1 hypothetical protein [Chloracidobacterium sp.]MBK9436856.1 hypothetical protein [Chloracidobacterium sp.]MBK9766512.1 hypothetical protein [Chloracidobacterium sp.]
MFPPIPTWEGLHPIIVHFPIALLMIAPVIIILGLLMPKNGRAVLISAFVLMLIGTIATFVAVSTGDAAGELAEHVPNVKSVLEEHEELAETTQTVFAALTTIFGVMLFAPMIFKKELSRKIVIPLNVAFLVFYGAGVVLLMNTAHQGGRLVHEFGVTANNPQSTQTTPGAVEKRSKKDDHDD